MHLAYSRGGVGIYYLYACVCCLYVAMRVARLGLAAISLYLYMCTCIWGFGVICVVRLRSKDKNVCVGILVRTCSVRRTLG